MRLGVYILTNNKMDILSAKNLSKFYSKNKGLFNKQSINLRAVNNININLKAKESLGIVGESGCGKSTLAKMLAGLIAPSSGKIKVQDRDINNYEKYELPNHIQYMYIHRSIYQYINWHIKHNIKHVKHISKSVKYTNTCLNKTHTFT